MTLSYTTIGAGPVHVLVAHSWPASSATLTPLHPYLDTDGMTWVFPDFRGYGSSADLSGQMTTWEMAQDLLDVVDELGWDSFHLVGHSMGGKAAQLLSGNAHARDRIRTLSLVSAVPSRGFPLDADTEKVFTAAANDPEVMAAVVTNLTAGRLGPQFGKHIGALSTSTASAPTLEAYLRAWSVDDVSAEVGGYTNPVLVLTGEFDPVLTADLTAEQIVPQFIDVRQDVVVGAGHFPPAEAPARTAGLLTAHISRRPDDVATDR
ncbi:alpha/beta fold hydrolase [Micromonospora sp. WMMD558]|uniref:alpha/beta fold hydrolase n=1 Tax=Micromonospora sp. WMMD558 TaxID=3403462 RepID=UPI003BF5CC70